MKHIVRYTCLLGLVLAAGLTPRTAAAELSGCDSPKVDNYVLFVDQSGSMYQPHAEAGEVKELLVKRALLEMNEVIPSFCCLKSSLFMFAPFETVKESYVYDHDSMQTRIGWIPNNQHTEFPLNGKRAELHLTPMAQGFADLAPVASELKGKTAIIVFTDGGANTGGDPIQAARALVAAKPGTCLHVVSFADEEHGREINKQLSQITPECRSVEGTEILGNGPKMQQFSRDVFCKPIPPLARRGG